MIIQVILIAVFAVLLVRFLAKANSSQTKAWKKIIGIIFAGVAVIAVLFPGITDRVAHSVGIGRGADLLLYAVTMAFIATMLSNYAKRKQDNVLLVKLARRIAIIEAKQNTKPSKK